MLPTSRRRYPFKHHHNNVTGTGSGESNSRVAIQRTTSETLRIERDLEVTNINGCKVTEIPSVGCTIKKPTLLLSTTSSSFVVTNVIPRSDYTEVSDSPEPDSFSIETPSFSEDTQSYSRDFDDLVLVSSTNTAISSSSALLEDVCEKKEVEDSIERDTESLGSTTQKTDGRYIGRFQVVKVESMGKFKRGRWHYQDYLDDSPHVPTDGYIFKDGSFVKNLLPSSTKDGQITNEMNPNVQSD